MVSSKMLKPLNLLLLLTLSLEMDIKILRPPNGKPGPAPCALSCSGTEDLNNWQDGLVDKAYMTVNYEECGFVSNPVVTVSVAGRWPGGILCPSVNVQRSSNLKANLFYVHTVEPATGEQMRKDECRVNWSAFGYNC